MDEAALCDRIALIQEGTILKIDTPMALVNHFPKKLYNIKAHNMYQLIRALNTYEHRYSVFPFGEFVHYTDIRDDFKMEILKRYLEQQGLQSIQIELTKPTIEDTFMELAR